MKKLTLLLMGSLLCGSVFSQPFAKRIFVANGGVFEFSLPYADYATLGYFDISGGTYHVVDTIYTQSVQDIHTIGDDLYLAAQDSIVKYDISGTIQRTNTIEFPSIRFVKSFGSYVVAGKWFGSGDYVRVYNGNNMNLMYNVPDTIISSTVYDAVIANDSLYVSFNLLGTVDNCPPYGCYDDSLGRIGVIELGTGTYVRTIDLGAAGAGIRHMALNGNTIAATCVGSGNILSFDLSTQAITTDPVGITGSYGVDDSYLSGDVALNGLYSGIVDSYDVSSTSFPYTPNNNGSVNAAARDLVSDVLFYTQTDHASYGRLFWNDGVSLDSINVGIAPDAIVIEYGDQTSIGETNTILANVYPNPSNGQVTIEGNGLTHFHLYDLTGKEVMSASIAGSGENVQLDVVSGIYILKVYSDNIYESKKLIIR